MVTYCLRGLGNTYLETKEFGKALKYLLEAMEAAERGSNLDSAGASANTIRIIYTKLGKKELAMKYLQQALTIAEKTNYNTLKFNALGNIGRLYLDDGHFEEAYKYFSEAISVAKAIGFRKHEAELHKDLSKVCELQNNDKEALLQHFRQYAEIRESIMDEEKQKAILEMETRYNLERAQKEREIENCVRINCRRTSTGRTANWSLSQCRLPRKTSFSMTSV